MTDLELVATERDKWIKTLSKPKQPFSEPVKPLADKWAPPLECGMDSAEMQICMSHQLNCYGSKSQTARKEACMSEFNAHQHLELVATERERWHAVLSKPIAAEMLNVSTRSVAA